MAEFGVFLISAWRAVVELLGLCLIGQGVLALLAGRSRGTNPIYRLFALLTRPAIRLLRRLTPALIVDRHLPAVTFFVLLWLWLALALARRWLCAANGLGCA